MVNYHPTAYLASGYSSFLSSSGARLPRWDAYERARFLKDTNFVGRFDTTIIPRELGPNASTKVASSMLPIGLLEKDYISLGTVFTYHLLAGRV